MRTYLFCVFKTAVIDGYWSNSFFFDTSYSVTVEHELNHNELADYASTLVFCERVCTFSDVWFRYVIAYEIEAGKAIKFDTKSHFLIPRNLTANAVGVGVSGLRSGLHLDVFHSIGIIRNRAVGYYETKRLWGGVGRDDIATGKFIKGESRPSTLRMDATFAVTCFPFYRYYLETLDGLDNTTQADVRGILKEHEPYEGRRVIGAPSNNQRLRMAHKREAYSAKFCKHALQYGLMRLSAALKDYFDVMNLYSHKWGDGELPNLEVMFSALIDATSIWQNIAPVMGYTMPQTWLQTPNYFQQTDGFSWTPAPNSAIWRRSRRDIDKSLRVLFEIHQYLCMLSSREHRPGGLGWSGQWFKNQFYSDRKALAVAVFAEFDNLSAAIWRAVHAFTILAKLLVFQNPKGAGELVSAGMRQYFPPGSNTPTTPPRAIEYEFFEEIYPIDAAPFITTPPESNVATVTIPEEPPPGRIHWDNTVWPDEDTYMGSELESIVRDARQKLRELHRWANRLKYLFPWYWGTGNIPEPPKQQGE